MNNVKQVFGDKVYFAADAYDAFEKRRFFSYSYRMEVIFRSPDFDKISASLKEKVIFDGSNLYNVEHLNDLYFIMTA